MTRALDNGIAVSGRVSLAELAEQVIAMTDEVTATGGPADRWQTVGDARTIAGVLAIEDGRGRVESELHLVARWPPAMPLEQVAEHLRGRVRRAAATAGLDERLGAVAVAFDDLISDAKGV